MSSDQKQAIKKTCKKIIDECLKEVSDTKQIKVKLEHGFKEIDMKDDQFEEVFKILRDLENTETHIIELMFLMKMNDREELLKEAKKVTRDF
jgi:L-ribulose-5-phosphate 3-epimerase UlaE